jgi:hypothetical protein
VLTDALLAAHRAKDTIRDEPVVFHRPKA